MTRLASLIDRALLWLRSRSAHRSTEESGGLTQLMPATARYLSVVDVLDPAANLRGGARYLREQLTSFGRVDLALAAYNAEPGRVRRRRAVPAITETRTYVSNVTRGWHLGVMRAAALLRSAPRELSLPPVSPKSEQRSGVALFTFGPG